MLVAVIVIAIIALIVIAVLAAVRRGSGLRPLPEDARRRHSDAWMQIEAQFVDRPQDAVREADRLIVAVVRERGGRDDRLPESVARARQAAGTTGDGSMTENLRQAMIEYRRAISDLLGGDPRETAQQRRMEVSS